MELQQHLLTGARVALTGRLASMTQADAVARLAALGAHHSSSVTRSTTLLVVGDANWPLTRTGRMTEKLHAARRLQRAGRAIEIIDEEEFLTRLHGRSGDESTRKSFSPVELARLTGLTPTRLRSWVRAGLIEPVETRAGVPWFDYRQVCRAKSLLDLNNSGVTLKRMRRSLESLAQYMPDARGAADLLGRLELQGSRLILESPTGALMEPHGQLVFDFDAPDATAPVEFQRNETPDDLFTTAMRDEQAGQFEAAADAYRRLLEWEGPDADICFNLANTLASLGETAAAIERYRQSVELDPGFVEAWHNLGNLLAARGAREEAVEVFRKALSIDPSYADTHYSLADTLDDLGHTCEARPHWEAFLEYESTGEWADYVRKRLGECAG
jgi:Tfp pilus assembly protein PilF